MYDEVGEAETEEYVEDLAPPPEIRGLASWQAQAILRPLRGLQFIGVD